MKLRQLRKLIRETIHDLNESSFSVNSDVDRAFNSVGVYPPKMVNVGGDRYEGEIDKGWKLGYDEKSGSIDVNGQSFSSLLDAAKFYKQNKGKKATVYDRGPIFKKIRDELEEAMFDHWDDDRVQKNVSSPLHDAFAPNGHATPKGMRAVDDILNSARYASNAKNMIQRGALDAWDGDADEAVRDYKATFDDVIDMLGRAWDIHTRKY